MTVGYRYRVRPGKTTVQRLLREYGGCRFVWNHLVAESKRRYEEEPGSTFGYSLQNAELTRLRKEVVDEDGVCWLASLSSVAQQQTVRSFARARTKALLDRKSKVAFTKRRGLPRFKSRRTSLPTMTYTKAGFRLVTETDDEGVSRDRLKLAGGITIPVVWSRKLPSPPTSVTVYQDNLGCWWASFTVTIPVEQITSGSGVIGVDLGVEQTATTIHLTDSGALVDDPSLDLANQRHLKLASHQITKHQRSMARRKTPKGQDRTKGYETAKRNAAKAHQKVVNKRKNDAHQWAARLAREAKTICLEDFHPKFLAKTTMAKSAIDGGITQAKQALIWQTQKHGLTLNLINPKNTTQDCSTCGAKPKLRVELQDRTYQCDNCGLIMNRDKNSALNMINRAGLNPAFQADTKPTKDAAPHLVVTQRTGIPRL